MKLRIRQRDGPIQTKEASELEQDSEDNVQMAQLSEFLHLTLDRL